MVVMEQEEMESQNIETENQATPAVAASCRKYASDDNATFLENMKGHFNEFVNSSMEEHKTCFKNTMDKILSQSSMMFERLKARS
ncbi:unnamed protein product [Thlaspi arvense]|uniref:Uncharacterized protein n=1 Tax=Thlaspi arvense TaxID=13288 RepID=A0AAU9SCW7_THLAR|nr:unnamed protein product [Thlaspi arvense]